MGTLPVELRRSVTFDNGTEFARHHELHELGVETFFCDVRSPWQKGEWRMRSGGCGGSCRRGRTWTGAPDEELTLCASRCNNTPRSALGYRTPAEVFWGRPELLRFQCESTFPLSREL